MLRKLRLPSPAMFIALVSLFVALTSTGWAQNAVPLAKRALTADKAKVAANAQRLQGRTAAAIAATPGPATDAATLNGQTAAQMRHAWPLDWRGLDPGQFHHVPHPVVERQQRGRPGEGHGPLPAWQGHRRRLGPGVRDRLSAQGHASHGRQRLARRDVRRERQRPAGGRHVLRRLPQGLVAQERWRGLRPPPYAARRNASTARTRR